MTQKESLLKVVKIAFDVAALSEAKHKLSTTLAEAQNRPPEGGSDGSVNEELWSLCWAVEDTLGILLLELRKLDNHLKGR